MAILSLPLIQLGQLSVNGEGMCTKYWLTALPCPGKRVARLTDRLNMTIVVDWDVKQQINQANSNFG